MTNDRLTIKQAKHMTGLSYRTLQRYIAKESIDSIKTKTGLRLISKVSLLNYVASTHRTPLGRDKEADISHLLAEILELIPNSSVETLQRKQELRDRIAKLHK